MSFKDQTSEQLLEMLEKTSSRVTELHREYMGKHMPDQVYVQFAHWRDETLPELRKEILSRMK